MGTNATCCCAGPQPNDTNGVLDSFIRYMSYCLQGLNNTDNPYILGYAINSSPTGSSYPDASVPPELRPIGNTFTVYADPSNSDRSTINYCLNTQA